MPRLRDRQLVVGSWNVQRLTRRNQPQIPVERKFRFVGDTVARWLRSPGQLSPDMLFLCEVTQSGERVAADLLRRIEDVPMPHEYRARFYPLPDQAGGVSPCSYLLIWNSTHPCLQHLGEQGGQLSDLLENHNRPYLFVDIPEGRATMALRAAFSHEPSRNDGGPVLETCRSITQGIADAGAPARRAFGAFLLGDLNCPPPVLNPPDNRRLEHMGWRIQTPIELYTYYKEWYWEVSEHPHRTRSLLDFMVLNGALPPPEPLENTPNFSQDAYALVDHRPVAFALDLSVA